jgi:hypothetical protein
MKRNLEICLNCKDCLHYVSVSKEDRYACSRVKKWLNVEGNVFQHPVFKKDSLYVLEEVPSDCAMRAEYQIIDWNKGD